MNFVTKPNSWVAQDAASNTQLHYALRVNPAPITVSAAGEDPVYASLEFVITNPTGSALDVESVAFTIQVGSTSDCLTATTAGIKTTVSDTTDWIVTPPPSPVTSGSASYTLGPASGSVSLAAGASVIVQIFEIGANTVSGNSTIAVKEIVTSTPAFTHFLVTTFPAGFYFDGLAATVQSDSSLIPVAQINTGSTVTLTWNSSVVDTSAFTIYYSNASLGQQITTPTDIGQWVSPSLTGDTVFTVAVTASVQGGQPLKASMSTAVSVQNPDIVAHSLVAESLTAQSVQINPWGNDSVLNAGDTSGGKHQLIGTYSGWGTENIFIAGYNAANNSGKSATKNVVIGGSNEEYWTVIVDLMNKRVGINTANPQATLDVNGSLNVSGLISGHGIVPIGSIIPFAAPKANVPSGWLLCDGSVVSRTTYASLYQMIGDNYGSGDGATTFNLPDYRGEFLRGTDDGAGQDPDAASRTGQVNSNGGAGTASGDTVGSRQKDELMKHNHNYLVSTYHQNTNWSGDSWGNTSQSTSDTGGSETRPKNVYVNYLIRAE